MKQITDYVITLGHSIVQHGKNSDRVYLMKWSNEDFPHIMEQLLTLAHKHHYTKIIVKVPEWASNAFLENGYQTEAKIPHFYNAKDSACFLSYYLDVSRSVQHNAQELSQVLSRACGTQLLEGFPNLPEGFSFSRLNTDDAPDMATLYQHVFASYPFPIFDPSYLRRTMQDNLIYFGIRHAERLVAVASCETDSGSQSVEMTDFATCPEFRSQGFASYLLYKMEHHMMKCGILTAYTIARAVSYGMNITFAKHGYTYGGRLIHNTNIAGSKESMNVWYKHLCSLPIHNPDETV